MPTKVTTIVVNELGLSTAAQQAADAANASALAAATSAAAALAAENSLLEWKGPWVTATAYAPSDVVSEAGASYVCIVAHTSGTFSTDLSAARWQLLAAQGATGPGSGDLLAANNLSDLANAATARANLGLGLAATGYGGWERVRAPDTADPVLDWTTYVAYRKVITAITGDLYEYVLPKVTGSHAYRGSRSVTVVTPGTTSVSGPTLSYLNLSTNYSLPLLYTSGAGAPLASARWMFEVWYGEAGKNAVLDAQWEYAPTATTFETATVRAVQQTTDAVTALPEVSHSTSFGSGGGATDVVYGSVLYGLKR